VLEESTDQLHFKLFLKDQAVQLSHVMPILENFGLSVAEERPYKVKPKSGGFIWLSDFTLLTTKPIDITEVTDKFKEAFSMTWSGIAENDRLNSLIVYAGLNWREVSIIRGYTRYVIQIGVRLSQQYIEDSYTEYAHIVRDLVNLFDTRLNPGYAKEQREQNAKEIRNRIYANLVTVSSLDQDRLLRRLCEAIQATQRTNFYQKDANNQPKEYISFKMIPAQISDMPKPVPMFEIFMYSPRVEGLHLRGAKVARGGLRWSDRKEDYRTEILGLVKAQQVKNAVIVPLGAKGGFLPKRLPITLGREAVMEEAINCYRMFISSLLDITDNIKNNEVIKPKDVVCYDEDDPYLVVAADKGTATFSDIANSVAAEYDFWLGDAFASGGSNGYDHKKMGITAKGAWESVKRHFREKGKDIQNEDFTVVGIGDMSGDVFGNGMLLSKHIRLLGAFNHAHIFIDPNPDTTISFKERKRLFDLPRSTWEDYDTTLISQGGGIFSRQAKAIVLSPQMKALLKINADELEPNKVIQLLLKAEYELLWNGGIGTYVKAHTESNIDVGDRANDSLRVNGRDLNCLVVGEGGNLGFTQLGRVEFALKGGAINTDAIDNAAGVDCSDHEVNIKILLNMAVEKGELTEASRNKLLAEMSDDVARLVLHNNYAQNRTIANELHSQELYFVDSYARLMRELERKMQLDREVEYLPSDKVLQARALSGKSITAPEFAVIMAYTKTMIKQQILKSNLPDDPHFAFFLLWEFPTVLRERYSELMQSHKLKREIIATQITNAVTLHMGVTFIQRLYDETGASVADIIKAFIAVVDIFSLDKLWQKVEKLRGQIPAESLQNCLQILFRFVRRNCRWILRNEPRGFLIGTVIEKYRKPVSNALKVFPRLLISSEKQKIESKAAEFVAAGIPKSIVDQVLSFKMATSVMDLTSATEIAKGSQLFEEIAILLNQKLWLSWFRSCINRLGTRQSYWGTLSTSALRDDLDKLQYRLVRRVIESCSDVENTNDKVEHWLQANSSYLARWNGLIDDMRVDEPNFESVNIAFRSLEDLARSR
jgi:glutamate dehydrogenase